MNENVKKWLKRGAWVGGGLLLLIIGLSFGGLASPSEEQFCYFINKFGNSLPAGQNIAEPGQQGPTRGIHTQGWKFYNPFVQRAEYVKMVEVTPGQICVLTQLIGQPLPEGQVISMATKTNEFGLPEGEHKGELNLVLGPGKYRVHPAMYAHNFQRASEVPTGCVGVVTAKTGLEKPAGQKLAKEGQRGVQERLLEPGTYYLNPTMYEVKSVSIRSQMTNFHDDERTKDIESIEFPSNDGFSIVFDVSVEWRVDKTRVAEVFMLLGEVETINANVITPNTRSISRVEGSKFGAKELIQGASREKFEVAFEQEMKEVCSAKGIEVMRALVRSIKPPDEVSKPIRETEVARQEELRNRQQMETAKSAAAKAEEEAKILQRQEQIKADTAKLVAETEARRKLAVAEIDLQTAKKEAENTVTRGRAEADVIFAKKKAEADGVKTMIDAYGGGDIYAMQQAITASAPQWMMLPVGEGTLWTDPTKFMEYLVKMEQMRQKKTDGQKVPQAPAADKK